MKERPILFSAPMVLAILDGSKTQTRRSMKIDPNLNIRASPFVASGIETTHGHEIRNPHGSPGDQLWVRETFFAFGRWETRFSKKKKRDEWHFIDMTADCDRVYQYAADNPDVPVAHRGGVMPGWWKRPAIFMPRAASRIQLEITEIRVERLQNISEEDAVAEGIKISCDARRSVACYGIYECRMPDGKTYFNDSAYELYKILWNQINGAGSWYANPFVWVISMKVV